MSDSALDDITISFQETPITIGTTNFNLPLIVGQSTESGAPTDTVKRYRNLQAVSNDFDSTSSARIYNFAEAMFENGAGEVAILNVDRPSTPTASDLSTALSNHVDVPFFYVVMTSREATASSPQGVDGDRADVSQWCDDNDRFFIATSNVGEAVSDITSDLNNNLGQSTTYFLAYENTNVTDSSSLDQPVDAGLAGDLASAFPGSQNFKFQNLDEMDNGSNYSSTEITDIENAGGAVYLDKRGVAQTSNGSTPTDDYGDTEIIKLYIQEELRDDFIELAVNQDKIPYTEAGIEQVKGMIEKVFDTAVEEDLIAENANGVPQFTIDMPDLSEISSTNKSDRLLPDIFINSTLSGAIDEVDLTINLQV